MKVFDLNDQNYLKKYLSGLELSMIERLNDSCHYFFRQLQNYDFEYFTIKHGSDGGADIDALRNPLIDTTPKETMTITQLFADFALVFTSYKEIISINFKIKEKNIKITIPDVIESHEDCAEVMT